MRILSLFFSLFFSLPAAAYAPTDSSGFSIVFDWMRSKHRNYDLSSHFRNDIPVKTPDLKNDDEYGSRMFSSPASGVIARWNFRGAHIYEGAYFSTELEAGIFLYRSNRSYFYRSFHSNDCLFYDRYIFDEYRDELYLSYGKTITLPMGRRFSASSGARVSVQQSLHATGKYQHFLSYKVKGTSAYSYTPNMRDPGDIFGRPKKTEVYEGDLKPSTGLMLEVPLVVGFRPGRHISVIGDFRWGIGMSLISGTEPLFKSMFSVGVGLSYDL